MKKKYRIWLWFLALGIVLVLCKNNMTEVLYPVRYQVYVDRYAEANDLDPNLVLGVIKAESNFIPDAHSGVATGLMQITDETGAWITKKMGFSDFSPEDLLDPRKNIQMGCFYLRYLIDYYGDLDLALAAYNAGPGNVNKWLSDPKCSADGKTLSYIPFTETKKYVERVRAYSAVYAKRTAEQEQ